MESDREPEQNTTEANPFSSLGEIVMFTDHMPTRKEIIEAKKQQLRERFELRRKSNE